MDYNFKQLAPLIEFSVINNLITKISKMEAARPITMSEVIAKICHQANKAYCESQGDFSQKDWEEAPEWQKSSAILGVKFRLDNPDASEDAQHNAWMKQKVDEGWVYGTIKDEVAKTHPCIVPYNKLPEFQRRKDRLFQQIVDAFI